MRKKSPLLVSVVLLPLSLPGAWRHEKYSAFAQNEVAFSEAGITLRVNESSSPLFHKLEKMVSVRSIELKAKASGLPQLAADKEEGIEGNDDFVLRLGLVQPGDYRPSWVERLFAPKWLLNLVSLAGEDVGFGKVTFLDVTQRTKINGVPRQKGKWIETQSVRNVTQAGDVSFTHAFSPPLPTVALWLHADGDDTKSKFTVTVSKIALLTP